MTQIAIVQPTAAPQAPQSNPSSIEESGSFSNHLDSALSKTSEKEQTAATPSERSDEGGDISETGATSPYTSSSSLITPEPVTPTNTTLKNGVTDSALSTLKSSLLPIEIGDSDILRETNQSSTSLPKTLTIALQNNAVQTQDSYQGTLQAKLQEIIENSSETGVVSITKANNSAGKGILSQFYGSEQIVASGSDSTESSLAKTSNAELFGINTKPEQANQQNTSLRQNIQNQYYDAKMSVKNIGDQKDAQQDNSQDMGNTPQPQSSSLQNNQLTPTNPSGSEFSILTGTLQDSSTTPVIDPARTTVLPSGLIVHEDDVVQQLVERFQVSRRQLDSRINIKLHPAELGELNINLSVKEGSIRAHVVAQSHHVQEIIEKNIAKLKTVLEDQGFSVAEISISSESESVGDFDLFDQQLFSNNDYEPQVKKDNSRMGTPFTIDDIEMEMNSDSIGVNVTA